MPPLTLTALGSYTSASPGARCVPQSVCTHRLLDSGALNSSSNFIVQLPTTGGLPAGVTGGMTLVIVKTDDVFPPATPAALISAYGVAVSVCLPTVGVQLL